MACHAARRLELMNKNLAGIIAIELLTSTQGVEFRAPVETSPALVKIIKAVRKRVKRLDQDRYLADDIAALQNMVVNREVVAVLEEHNLLPVLATK